MNVTIEGLASDMPKSYYEFARLMTAAEAVQLFGRAYFVVNVQWFHRYKLFDAPYLVVTLQVIE